jgi:hypothetical protein
MKNLSSKQLFFQLSCIEQDENTKSFEIIFKNLGIKYDQKKVNPNKKFKLFGKKMQLFSLRVTTLKAHIWL